MNNLRYLFILPFIFIIYYALVLNRFEVASCTVFYAVYHYPHGNSLWCILLFTYSGIYIFLNFLSEERNCSKKYIYFAGLLLTGHVIMAIPVLFAFLLAALRMPEMLNSVESIMCKFAFSYALCLTFFALNNKESVK
jgi:hypothetical protein